MPDLSPANAPRPTFKTGFARRITQAALTVTLGLFLIVGTAGYLMVHSLLQKGIVSELRQRADLAGQRLELNLSAVMRELSSFAATSVVSNALLDSSGRDVYLLPLLRSFRLPHDLPFTLGVYDFEGGPVAGTRELSGEFVGEAWVTSVIDEERDHAEVRFVAGEPTLLLARPVLFPATGRAEGMLVLNFPLAPLMDEQQLLLGPGTVQRLSVEGRSIYHSSPEVAAAGLVAVERGLELEPPLGRLGLTLSLGKSRAEVNAPLMHLALVAGAAALLLIGVVVYLVHRMAERLTQPLLSLSRTAQEISAGGELRSHVTVRGRDEVAALAEAFNEMVVRLREAHEELEARVEERTRDLHQARRAAEQANQAKTEFLANMSHELRTPMHAILSFAALGIDKVGPGSEEKIRHYLERIHESGARLLGLLNDLLDLSKLEAGMMEFERVDNDLAEVLDAAVGELSGLIRERGLVLERAATGGSTRACFDYDRLLQVVRNLLGNAIKFSPPGGTIHLAFGAEALEHGAVSRPALTFTIVDEGVGIPEEDIDSIFDKFVQSSKTKTGAGGTGLGLAICKEIVEAHGGRLRVRNGEHGGAAFTLALPREDGDAVEGSGA